MNPYDWSNCDPNDPDVTRDRQKDSNAEARIRGTVGGLKLCAALNHYVCTRLAGHDGPHMALTLAGRCLETWAPTMLDTIHQRIVSSPYIKYANGKLYISSVA